MSAMTNDSAVDKAALAMTKLEGHKDWPLWSTTIHVVMGGSWAYIGGNQVSAPSDAKDLHQENPQHLCLTPEDLHAACREKSHEPKYLKIPRLPKPHEPHKQINSKSTQIQQDS